MQTDED